LDVAYNQLTTLPEELLTIPSLKIICLRGNVFTDEAKKRIILHEKRLKMDCEE
jgi:hypothetical protein